LLETRNVVARLDKLLGWSQEQIAELDVAETINKDVKEGVERQQREFLLRQQLAAIRKELAELDGKPASEEEDYRARVEAAELPEHVRTAAMTEVDKLERTAEASPEVGWIRTWLDTVLEMPWNSRTEDNFDIADAREVMSGRCRVGLGGPSPRRAR
jgi:ATP-dependent Lon protease